jgi:pimeloyl-ACP methyl ester carboxylesterase
MADVHAYRRLSEELSESFTVIRAERRGRGISPRPYTTAHDIARDVEDLDAIMATTGATALFGLSSGAVIVLEAARTLPRVERVAVFEPPFYRYGIDTDDLQQLFDDIDHHRSGAALVGALTTAGTAPAFVARLPRWAGRSIGRAVLTVQAWRPGPAASLRALLPGVRYDFHDVAQVDRHFDAFASITLPVLIIRGTSSPRFLQDAAGALRQLLPASTLVDLVDLGHDGPWNTGDPHAVAAALTPFLRQPPTQHD